MKERSMFPGKFTTNKHALGNVTLLCFCENVEIIEKADIKHKKRKTSQYNSHFANPCHKPKSYP